MRLPRVRLTVRQACDLASLVGSPCSRWAMIYTRTMGGIQLLYAALFAWVAFDAFMSGEFYEPEVRFKGYYSPAQFDWEKSIALTLTALLSLTGLIAGCGLLWLRPRVRRWEAAYLLVLAVAASLCVLVAEGAVRASLWCLWPLKPGLASTVLFTAALGLPYVPFLSGAFVRAATGAAGGWPGSGATG